MTEANRRDTTTKSKSYRRADFLTLLGGSLGLIAVGGVAGIGALNELSKSRLLDQHKDAFCQTNNGIIGTEEFQKDQTIFIRGLESGMKQDGILTEKEQRLIDTENEKLHPNNPVLQTCSELDRQAEERHDKFGLFGTVSGILIVGGVGIATTSILIQSKKIRP